MQSSATSPPSSPFLRATGSRYLIRRRTSLSLSILSSPLCYSIFRSKNPTQQLRLSASLTDNHRETTTTTSWFSRFTAAEQNEEYNGWAVIETPSPSPNENGFSKNLIGGGACAVVAALAVVAYFSLFRNGFKLRFSRPVHGITSSIDTVEARSGDNAGVSDISSEFITQQPTGEAPTPVSIQKLERVKLSVLVDSTQLEALSVLKKLKIIEDDVRADELCTKREYARWLVRLNSLLERNPKHRIAYLSFRGSVVAAFDDVGVEDPDFDAIQALAEAGLIPSKITGTNSEGDGNFCFHPEKFISRLDLINWKAQLEYDFFPGMAEQMSRTKVDYMDVKDISAEASPEFFILLAGDNSIIRKVFGQSRRFQPNKPLTKAQAAVAMTSGRMSEAVYNEISRLEAENSSRQAALKEIRFEMLDKGDIERFWIEKINEERTRGLEVQKLYMTVLHDLELEKDIQVKALAECLKEKAAMNCQMQLLVVLKEEVDEMSEQLASERAVYAAEQCNLQKLLNELQTKQEGILNKKSVLEAEIEALRILRSWVEDEAKKSQARAKVLEEVGRRWKWENQG
ncbi:uncharacterized protein LOC126674407 isoform X2 [Mercurialis annua]|uniref:uncharacterized protein LOC126674407 isoform X2 n=1 Tax=Mercurialis annua TaxID=3986 RepID=UPI002160495A|nr:uncharacterized protein LOC126674407 isoform X2 [Mercurialis annua]